MRSGLRIGLAALALSSACGRIGYEPLSIGAAGTAGSGAGGSGAGGAGAASGGAGMMGAGGMAGSTGTAGMAGTAGIGGGGGSAGATAGTTGTGGAGGKAGTAGSGGAGGMAGGAGGKAGSAGGMAGGAGTGGVGGTAGGAGGGGGGSVTDAGLACTPATFNGHNYDFCGTLLSWSDAENDCVAKGMRLVRIDDVAENTWVHDTAFAGVTSVSSNYWRWIGGNDLSVRGSWRWTDGTLFWMGGSNGTPQGGLYSNWVGGAPSISGPANDCAILENAAFWGDFDCTRVQAYVCEQY